MSDPADPVLNAFMTAMDNGPRGDTPPEQSPASEAPAQEQKAQPEQAEEADAAQVEESQASEQDPDTPEAAADDVETIEIDPEAELFEQVLTDTEGKKVTKKLSLKELQQGYLRTADYTRKTQELAKQRAQVQEEVRQAKSQVNETYEKRLAELQSIVLKAVAPDLSSVDWSKLANEDAFEYVRLSNRRNEVQQLLQTIQAEQDKAQSASKEEQQKRKADEWQKSLEVLNREIPSFGPEVVKRIIDAAEQWGFSKDEVAQWTDHRQIRMLHALTERKAIEAKRPEIEKKVAVVTKVLKPGTKSQPKSALSDAKAQLRKTGRREDALPIFESILR